MQSPFKTIVVPTDFSPTAERAIAVAATMARNADVTLVIAHAFHASHVFTAGTYVPPMQQQEHSALGSCEQMLAQTMSAARAAGAVRVETKLLQGDVVDELARFASDRHADLIIAGTHGHGGLRQRLVGSVAEALVRHARCPVMLVRDDVATLADGD
jgi:nucleotide-binding universal stress UspA family protein